jgi:hypothetical protein
MAISLGIGMKAGIAFFDSKPVMRRLKPKQRKFFRKFGQYVKRRARTSMKPGGKKGKTSDPGDPPRYHTKFLRKGILYGMDMGTESVVIGPKKYGRGNADVLEEGGMLKLFEKRNKDGGVWRPMFGNRSLRPWEEKRTRRAKVEARPYMAPAFEAEKKNISTIWASS